MLKKLIEDLLRQEQTPKSSKEIIHWWEGRRLRFNIANVISGLFTLTSLSIFANFHPFFGAGLVFFVIVGFNVVYCLGWLTEIFLRIGIDNLNFKLGPILFGIYFLMTTCSFILYGLFEIINRSL